MMRSLFSGVSGLKTHQTKMDVIGNNIANVNTTAYKSSSITFSSLMSQTTQRASGANAATGAGGVNARQIGLGVKSAAINVNITGQGASQSTGNPFDVMISGENFFIVSDGSSNYFTRDGSFYVDGAGNLAMTSLGYNVMGWQVDEETGNIKKDTVSALRIMSAANMTYPPEATSEGYMSGIIDKHDKDVISSNGRTVNFTFYDDLGYSYTAKFVFKQSDDEHVYSLELDKIIDSEGKEIDLTPTDPEDTEPLLGGASLGAAKVLEKAGKLTFSKDFGWYNDNNNLVLQRTQGTPVTLADLSQIIDPETGDFRPLDEEIEGAPLASNTVQKQLDNIAAAYGYEGKTEDFLNLVYAQEVVAADDTANPPVEAVYANWTVKQLMLSSAGVNIEQNVTGAPNNPVQAPQNFFAVEPPAGQESTSLLPSGETVDIVGRSFEGIIVNFDSKNGEFAGINGTPTQATVTLRLSAIGRGNFSDITMDLSALSNLNNKGSCTATATSGSNEDGRVGQGAGRPLGDMTGVSIQQNGMIYASYDNGMTKLLGQIATAKFANASGLEKQADNLYSSTLNSGEFDGIGVDITADGDYMSTGQLEMSNVDLSSEFTEMITTQRGFQANSRIITVSDTLLEELTNLKR